MMCSLFLMLMVQAITKSPPTSSVCWTFWCVHSLLWFWWLSLNLFQLLTPRHASWDGLHALVWCSMALCHHQIDYLWHPARSCQFSSHHLWSQHQSHCHNDLDCSHPGLVCGYYARLQQAACCQLEERHLQLDYRNLKVGLQKFCAANRGEFSASNFNT